MRRTRRSQATRYSLIVFLHLVINLTIEVNQIVVIRRLLQPNDFSYEFVGDGVFKQGNQSILRMPDLRGTAGEVRVEVIKRPPSHLQRPQFVDGPSSFVLVSVDFLECIKDFISRLESMSVPWVTLCSNLLVGHPFRSAFDVCDLMIVCWVLGDTVV